MGSSTDKSTNARVAELSRLANVATQENRLTDAYNSLRELAELKRDDAETQSLAGCVAAALGEYTGATKWFARAVLLKPDDQSSYHNLGVAHIKRGALTDATRVYQSAIARGLGDAAMRHDLAVVYLQQGQTDEARRELLEALKSDPENTLCQAGLLEICRQTSDTAAAERYLSQWLADTPDSEQLQAWRADLKSGKLFGASDNSVTAGRAVGNKNVAIVTSNPAFMSDIVNDLKKNNAVREFTQGSMTELRALLEWADIAWFDWCDQLLIQATSHLPRLCATVCRLHSYEAFTEMPGQVEWSKVDHLILVNDSVRTLLGERIPKTVAVSVVPNAVDVERYIIPERKTLGKKIASVGYINYKKNPQLLLYLFKLVHDWDPEFELHIAGEEQDPRIGLYMRDMANKMKLPLVWHGWIKDMPTFYSDKDFIISTSLFESFHYSIAEGMACGLLPIVHDWFGSENVYPDEYRFRTPDEGLRLIQRLMGADRDELGRDARRHIVENFALKGQLSEIDDVLRCLPGDSGS